MTTKQERSQRPDNQTNKGVTVYNVGGYEIKLSKEIVRYTLLRGQDNVTDDEIVSFIALCKFNKLNPFIRECFLVKYKNAPAQMIVSKDAFFKRADTCPNYDGFEAGIIVTDGDGDVIEKTVALLHQAKHLVGGWCKVHRTDRTHPTVAKVNLSEYDKNQSRMGRKEVHNDSQGRKGTSVARSIPKSIVNAIYAR